MADLKTVRTRQSVRAFLDTVEPAIWCQNAKTVLARMRDVTGERPVIWGSDIVGFGSYRYTNSNGAAEWFLTGFSPRKASLTLYIMSGFSELEGLLAQLGRHRLRKSCACTCRACRTSTSRRSVASCSRR